MEILNQIFELCIVPLLGILTTYLVNYLRLQAQRLASECENQKGKKYIEMLNETVSACVLATKQTYVDSLKNKDIFDEEAQKTAFELTYKAVVNVLNQEAKDYLANIYGDLNTYLIEKIEAEVNRSK